MDLLPTIDPQVGPVTSRDGSPDCVLPALEDVPVVPPSTAPLMTIPPYVLSQLLSTTPTTTSTTTSRHTAATPVNPGLFSAPSTFTTKQQQQHHVTGKDRRENRRNVLVNSSSVAASQPRGPALLSTYSLPQSQSQSINIQEILAHLKHPPQLQAASVRNKKL